MSGPARFGRRYRRANRARFFEPTGDIPLSRPRWERFCLIGKWRPTFSIRDIINKTAKTARLTIWLIVPVLLGAITLGSFLIFRAVGYEMRLARQKTDFVSNVSHELKTPLTSIRMFSDLLAGGTESVGEKTREYSGIISKEAARLSRLINNLLDFARIDRGEMPFHEEQVDLVSLTQETVDMYRMQLESEGCHLQYESEVDGPVILNGDRDALARVLLNLLSNAEKYGCEGGEIEVRLSQPESGTVRWEVLDRGPGIERRQARKDIREILPGRRFTGQRDSGNRFGADHRRADRAKTMRAKFFTETAQEEAACSLWSFPLYEKIKMNTNSETTIFIVEDDPSIRFGLEEVLKAESFRVASCERGDEAIEKIGEHLPDLIVLDVMLPGRNGYEICKDLRKRGCRLPILMLTAKGQEIDKVVGLDSGADDYVTKPFGVQELIARVNALLRRTQTWQESESSGSEEKVPALAQKFTVGRAEIDPTTYEAVIAGADPIRLTPKEMELLNYFDTKTGTGPQPG